MGTEWAIVAAAVVALLCVVAGWSARGAVSEEAERRHRAERENDAATIRGLQAELAADRKADSDGAEAAQGVVDAASRLGRAAPGDERVLWADPGRATGSGGNAPPTPPAPS